MQKVYLIGLLLFLLSSVARAAPIINSIQYQGNDVSQTALLNREIFIAEGDEFNERLVEKSRQGIMNLGLYKSVSYRVEPVGALSDGSVSLDSVQAVDVIFSLSEKYYVLLIPRARIDDEDKKVGLQLLWNNVWGMNHEMELLYENRGRELGIKQKRELFRYDYPNINNTPYSLYVELFSINEVDTTEIEALDRQDDILRLAGSRWLNDQGRNRGWFAGASVLLQHRRNLLLADQSVDYTDAVVLGLDVGYDNVSNYEYNRGGKAYGYTLDWSHDSLGSDSQFTKHVIYYRSYYRFDSRPLSNLNVQTRLGHSNNYILGDTAFSLGGSSDLRGYENDRFNGNTMLLTNIEYVFPYETHPLLRYVTFIDLGNTYDELSDIFHRQLHVGAGFGLRWKIKSFVRVDLRADIGYGFSDQDYHVSFGTRHAF
jgi:outer membrane protein assembly factor BamA